MVAVHFTLMVAKHVCAVLEMFFLEQSYNLLLIHF